MSFSLTASGVDFAAAVASCAQVVDRSGTIPILKCVRISVADGVATMMATNTEQSITTRFPAEGSGVVCIDCGMIEAKAKALIKAPMEMVGDGKNVTLSQGRAKWKLPCWLDDFPIPSEIEGSAVEFGADFIAGLKQCKATTDAKVSYLAGVHVDGDRVVATSGKQLRIIQHAASLPVPITIPSDAVTRIVSMFPDGAEVRASPLAASFSSGGKTLKTRLIGEAYPPYRRVLDDIVKNSTSMTIVDADEFSNAVGRAVALISEGGGLSVRMEIMFRDDTIELSTRNKIGEEGSDHVEAERVCGGDVDVVLDGAWISSASESLDCDVMEIAYKDRASPIIMRPKASVRENIRVIMPRAF